jgi:hypothetical protein
VDKFRITPSGTSHWQIEKKVIEIWSGNTKVYYFRFWKSSVTTKQEVIKWVPIHCNGFKPDGRPVYWAVDPYFRATTFSSKDEAKRWIDRVVDYFGAEDRNEQIYQRRLIENPPEEYP